jgi:hypothetical protein
MAAADIDIGAGLLAGEGERQMIVLKVLRVGQLLPRDLCLPLGSYRA